MKELFYRKDLDMESISCKVKDLSYTTIEEIITTFYEMGYPEHSNLPQELTDNECWTYTIFATKKYGDFHIRVNKQKDEYYIYVYPYKIKNIK